ncbi:hypothetical protein CO165_00905 [Candidatus Roizmanbacteria bacterium CG_4_9_14_3_um_filter_33_18]|uniref:Uncharacterized protein n=3 Tax=Candidatus Roizmaniibacteriota TaxID=1752723 RepID=A0A2M7U7P3_9BACT|nr:MAG: hypothetical protein COW97_01585 [Candidatus Roizmanbacteria bacterium CG22_combo_CG10-13_8_21_14_all_34_12]PIZ67260.1 MAG: hypothetical protein COY12_02240 [Candidatus Roizmanbacteria bacterium CG_4_10_14_0_2_um_filter_33_96]PJA55929.1 MAG: hypothetical protein CO165_00905 [Candidatus Roizmanbacteria bacterium CG_4_9_14_3_um_filter_33_18]
MSKKDSITTFDFQTGLGGVIPSTQEAYNKVINSQITLKKETENIKQFKINFEKTIINKLKLLATFPTKKEVFVFIVQYFNSVKDYSSRDIDNMAKTILDTLKGKFYYNDSQVKTLLVQKDIKDYIPQDFIYVAIKEIKNERDVEAVKISGIDRARTYYNEFKKTIKLL